MQLHSFSCALALALRHLNCCAYAFKLAVSHGAIEFLFLCLGSEVNALIQEHLRPSVVGARLHAWVALMLLRSCAFAIMLLRFRFRARVLALAFVPLHLRSQVFALTLMGLVI